MEIKNCLMKAAKIKGGMCKIPEMRGVRGDLTLYNIIAANNDYKDLDFSQLTSKEIKKKS